MTALWKEKTKTEQKAIFLISHWWKHGERTARPGRQKKSMLAWSSQETVGMRKGLRDGPVQSERKEGGNVERVIA